jgi:hypothetical protein
MEGGGNGVAETFLDALNFVKYNAQAFLAHEFHADAVWR